MRLTKFVIVSCLILSCGSAYASKKMLLVGDSWAMFMCVNGSFKNHFERLNLDVEIDDCTRTSRTGARADTWYQYATARAVMNRLEKQDVDVVYLSIGGNDMMRYWTKTISASEEETLHNTIMADTKKIIDQILTLSPQTKVLLSGYDYANFEDFSKYVSAYRKDFERMGRPTPLELNTASIRMSERMSELSDNKKIFYIQHYGLMHYYFGSPEHGLDVGTTLSPEYISAPGNPNTYGGVLEYEGPKDSMLEVSKVYRDAFHLGPEGYSYLAEHAITHYLQTWLK